MRCLKKIMYPSARTGFALALVLPVLAGCGVASVGNMRELAPTGDSFADALAAEYRQLALYEADEMVDWGDAGHFADKALDAASGYVREPEAVSTWNIPDGDVPELDAARERLMTFLNTGAGDVLPEQAAKAQASYDCWLEQLEENWQTEHIALCRDAFYTALGDVDQASRPQVTVFFEFDSDVMEEEEFAKLQAFARHANLFDVGAVVIDGHADRAGEAPYNQKLSRERSIAVWRKLVEAGMSPDRMAISSRGETDPAIQTPDGTREPLNRRAFVQLRLPPLYATIASPSDLASAAE